MCIDLWFQRIWMRSCTIQQTQPSQAENYILYIYFVLSEISQHLWFSYLIVGWHSLVNLARICNLFCTCHLTDIKRRVTNCWHKYFVCRGIFNLPFIRPALVMCCLQVWTRGGVLLSECDSEECHTAGFPWSVCERRIVRRQQCIFLWKMRS